MSSLVQGLGQPARRFAAVRFFVAAWLVLLVLPLMQAYAQDEAAKNDDAPAAAAAPAAPAKASGEEPAARRSSMLSYLLRAHSDPLAAFIGLLLLGISIWFFAQVIRFFIEFRVEEAVPPVLVEKIETSIKERKFQEAYDACKDDNSFLARLLRTGIANLPNGRNEAKEAMNTTAEEMIVSMESRISYLATIGTLGPMIGLVGTIWGMIHSFQEIAMATGQQVAADRVAGGIATALFITLEGISLSVPAIFFFAFFRNRIAQVAMEGTKIADRTISAFWMAAKQQQTAQPVKA
jgi:biopolymer transport protein ExbB